MALAQPDQSSHQVIKQGNAPSVSHSVHKAHGAVHASVVSQPHASPQSVHGYGHGEKAPVANLAPAALPYKARGYHAPAPVYHAPSYHAPAPTYHAPVLPPTTVYHKPAPAYHAPVVKAAPAYHAPAPVYHAPAPAYHAPVVKVAPTYHAPVVKAVPTYHAPVVKSAPAYHPPAKAAYHPQPTYADEISPYTYNYAVADDYSKAVFSAGETSDGASNVKGSYSVNLPDGRVQHVTYHSNGYDGFVADVTYEGEAHYPTAPKYHAPAPKYVSAPLPSYQGWKMLTMDIYCCYLWRNKTLYPEY